MPLKEFLETVPPGLMVRIQANIEATRATGTRAGHIWTVADLDDIALHCTYETCGGIRTFETTSRNALRDKWTVADVFVSYLCRNCQRRTTTFAIRFHYSDKTGLEARKFGQYPEFGDPTPAQVITLAGRERDYFLKGRKSENAGLGIAAFTYYRRVIEHQKNQIFDEVIKVSRKLGADDQLIAELEVAKREKQFTKGVDQIKRGLPQVLLIDGYNPLLLLHDALSSGIHEKSDAECLAVASSIRKVLTDFVRRASEAVKDDKGLTDAVGELLKWKARKPS